MPVYETVAGAAVPDAFSFSKAYVVTASCAVAWRTAVPTAVYPLTVTPMPSVWLLQTPTHATKRDAACVLEPNAAMRVRRCGAAERAERCALAEDWGAHAVAHFRPALTVLAVLRFSPRTMRTKCGSTASLPIIT